VVHAVGTMVSAINTHNITKSLTNLYQFTNCCLDLLINVYEKKAELNCRSVTNRSLAYLDANSNNSSLMCSRPSPYQISTKFHMIQTYTMQAFAQSLDHSVHYHLKQTTSSTCSIENDFARMVHLTKLHLNSCSTPVYSGYLAAV